MNSISLRIERLDASLPSFAADIAKLRKKLSPDGSVVSERGRQLTLSVFGEALSPQSVVERICNDVRDRGTEAVLKYARALDNKDTTAETLRVPASLIEQAHATASPEFLSAVRRIRTNIVGFQSAILHKNTLTRPALAWFWNSDTHRYSVLASACQEAQQLILPQS